MKISDVSIKNFRKLKDITFKCKGSINTIVGPNGIGKSSIIEAIRLIKSVLLQSVDNEAQTALQIMGLFSPQTQSVLFNTICNDPSKQTKITLSIVLEAAELDLAKNKINDLVILRLQNSLGQNNSNRLALIGYLSSPGGQQQYQEVLVETTKNLENFINNRKAASIELTISSTQIEGKNGFDQELVSFILRQTPASHTLFSVFPADRNFPTGDVNIQLGQGDLQQQIQSYNIQPNLKFARLKNTIVNRLLLDNNDINPIKKDFELIFKYLLPGKALEGIMLDPATNKLVVLIREIDNNAVYDIDFLSSGEKGLLLTLFLLTQTIANGGIVIIDEPELHLNPAVCKNIINFLKDHVATKLNVQIILTTHSAEILSDTKEDESLQLLHIIDSNTISTIYKQDNDEASDAIKSLGISVADLLFNKGVIYLEGTTDEAYINEVLKGYTMNFKVQSLGGRGIIENEVKILQESDKAGKLNSKHIFILDLDNKPFKLESTSNVKVLQWDRYSFENYFLGTDILYNVIRDRATKNFPTNRAEFVRIIKDLALQQIDEVAINEIYMISTPQSVSMSKKEIKLPINTADIAQIISNKIAGLINSLASFDENTWKNKFIADCSSKTEELKETWNEDWKKVCKGKELLNAIYNNFGLSNYKEFVKALIVENRLSNSEEWLIITNKIESVIL